MSTFEDLITSRVRETMDQWPMLDAVYACENCKLLFKDPVKTNMRCPGCGGQSIFNAAAILNKEAELTDEPAPETHSDDGSDGRKTETPGER